MTLNPSSTPPGPHAAALPELLEHADWLRRLAHSLVRDGSEAEDVFQESMRVAEARLKRDGSSAAVGRSWLAGVARMVTRSRRRQELARARRDARSIREHGLSTVAPSTLDDLELVDQQRILLEHIGALPAAERRVILARFYEGLAPREIATDTAAPVSTVKSQIRRGLAKLRTSLDTEYGDRRTWGVAFVPLAKLGAPHAVKAGVLGAGAHFAWLGLALALASAVWIVVARPFTATSRHAAAEPAPSEIIATRQAQREGSEGMRIAPASASQRRRTAEITEQAASTSEPGEPGDDTARSAAIQVEDLLPPIRPDVAGGLVVRCYQAETSLPAQDVLASLFAVDAQQLPDGRRARRTDEEGVARWTAIPAGRYRVLERLVDVPIGDTVEVAVDISWGSTIHGHVVDWSGRPVHGAQVSDQTGARAMADTNGFFEIHGAADMAWVKATAAGYQRSDMDVISASERTTRDLVLTMRRGGASITGTVFAPGGSAAGGVRVRVKETSRHEDERHLDYGNSSASCVSDRDGRYRFDGLLPVPHEVTVRAGPWGSFEAALDVTADGSESLDIRLPAGLEIFGKVTDAHGRAVPQASVGIYGRNRSHRGDQFTETDQDGMYRVTNAPSDVSEIRASHEPGGRVTVRPIIPRSGSQRVDLVLSGDSSDPGGFLFGQLVDGAGTPLAGWSIIASSDSGKAHIGTTDEGGRFSAEQNRPWMDDLSVAHPSGAMRILQSFPGQARGQTRPTAPITLTVTVPLGTIRGRVKDSAGGMPEDAEVYLECLTGIYHKTSVAGSSSAFEWRDLTPGPYEVRFQATGRATRRIPLMLEPGATVDLGVLTSSEGGSLRLTVNAPGEVSGDARQYPLFVFVADREGVSSPALRVDARTSLVGPIAEGPVLVTVASPPRGLTTFEVTIEGGRTTNHAVQLERGYVASLQLTIDGCAIEKRMGGGGIMVGYSIEDALTGAYVGSFGAGTARSEFDLIPLPLGSYRVQAFTPDAHRGEVTIHVTGRSSDRPHALDLVSPGL